MNFLKKSTSRIKNVLFFALIVIFVSLELAFPQPASAGLITSALLALPGILLALWGFFTNLFAQLAIVVFNWVTSPAFIDWSYTQNPVINVGLGVTKQFVNMGLVVVLIFIALSIALRLKEYASQKTLIRLIAVALLVNFAPVICGLIVDAANIAMNYFLSPIKEGVDSILGGVKGSFALFSEIMSTRKDPSEQLGLFGRLGVSVIFNAVIGFTFFLLAVIFIVRYLAIWVLVILAPLAFVAWILPATKKFWDQWWQQFIQWSIIGIPIAFFLYLAMASLGVMRIQFENKMPMVGLEPEISVGVNYFNEFFAYMMVVIMIWLGIIIGLSTSAMGATGIMDFAKTKGKATVGGVGKGAIGGVGKGAKWVGRRAARGVGRYAEEKAGVKEKIGKVSEKVSKVPALRWFLPERVKKYGEFRPAIDEAKAEAKAYKSPVLMDDVMTGAAIGKRAGGFTLEAAMRGDSEDIFQAGRRKFGKDPKTGKDFTDEQLLHHEGFRKIMKRTLQVEKEGGYLNDVIRRDPRLAALLTGESWAGDYEKMTETQAIQQATSEARGSHITNWEKQVVAKEHYGLPVTEKLMERGREPFENIARNVKQGVETVQDSIDTLFSDYVDNVLSKTNSALANMVKLGDPKNTEVAWGLYREHFKAQPEHKGQEGFFVALEGQRFRDLGYRQGKYIAPPPSAPPAVGKRLGISPTEGA